MISELVLALLENCWPMLAGLSGKSSFPRPLSQAEEKKLIERKLEGDTAAGQRLVEHNLRLVAHIAKKYRDSGCDADDLVSIGAIGLMKAVATFRPSAGKLTSYASRCIENEILMHLRATRKLRGTVSLHDPVGADKEGNEMLLMDILSSDSDDVDVIVEKKIDHNRAKALINERLDKREKQVILLRYGLAGSEPLPQHDCRSCGMACRIDQIAWECTKLRLWRCAL